MTEPSPGNDLGDAIRDEVRKLVAKALEDGSVNLAAAVNWRRGGQTTVAYSDDDVTIVRCDGETFVSRPRNPPTAKNDPAEPGPVWQEE